MANPCEDGNDTSSSDEMITAETLQARNILMQSEGMMDEA